MNNQRNSEIKVGVVSIVSLLLLIVGIMLGKSFSFTSSEQRLQIKFPNSGGIDPGSPVFVNGVKRGKTIAINNVDGGVVVEVALENWDDIREDASAKILMLELTGGKKIEITPGISGVAFNPKNTMAGLSSADATMLIADLGDVANDAKMLIKRLDTISAKTSELLNDTVFVGNIKSAAKGADVLLASLNNFYGENHANLRASITAIKALSDELRTAVNVNEPKVRTLLDKLDQTAVAAKKTMDNADNSLEKLDQMLAEARGLLQDVKKGEGTVSKLIYDKQAAMRLDSVLQNLGVFVEQVRQHGINTNIRLGTRP